MKLNHNILYIALFMFPTVSFASTSDGTIIDQYAWGENAGWVNFLPTNGNIHVTDTAITGYAWDKNYGWINFAPTYSGVKNDGAGNLSGSAWSAGGGWIDFDNVSINDSGKFEGIASGSVYGQLTFDCDHCSVTTDWRPATTRSMLARSTGNGGSFINRGDATDRIENSNSENKTKTISSYMQKKVILLNEYMREFISDSFVYEATTTATTTETNVVDKRAEARVGVIITIILFLLFLLFRILILSFRQRSR